MDAAVDARRARRLARRQPPATLTDVARPAHGQLVTPVTDGQREPNLQTEPRSVALTSVATHTNGRWFEDWEETNDRSTRTAPRRTARAGLHHRTRRPDRD